MSWAGRRQFIYSFGFLIFILGLLTVLFYPIFYKAPSCMDGKKNGNESGVDCGGSCLQYCSDQVSSPIILWSRIFPVSGSKYNLISYIENQNINAGVPKIGYQFKVYDGNNVLITTREGVTFVEPNGRTAIFEPGLNMGNRVPRRTAFSFTTPQTFYKLDARFAGVKVFAKECFVQD